MIMKPLFQRIYSSPGCFQVVKFYDMMFVHFDVIDLCKESTIIWSQLSEF